jgi:hypothetical protein
MQSNTERKASARMVVAVSLVASMLVAGELCVAQEIAPAKDATKNSSADATKSKPKPAPPKLPEPKGATRFSKDYPVWVDKKEKTVIVDGQIALREGMLEMFACTRNTKEHESIVSANTRAYIVQAGLIGLGAEPGHPVRFQPRYEPPAGTEIEVSVQWLDEKGKLQTARAQDWIKDLKTGKAMTYPFVLAGSSMFTDPDTGKQHFQAEGGDFVCVSNFGTAMLDIPVKSSQSNEELEFEAFTKKIPPLGAPVRLIFKPKLTKTEPGKEPPGANEQKPTGKAQQEKKAGGVASKPAGGMK